jgi:hypothetical protein
MGLDREQAIHIILMSGGGLLINPVTNVFCSGFPAFSASTN